MDINFDFLKAMYEAGVGVNPNDYPGRKKTTALADDNVEVMLIEKLESSIGYLSILGVGMLSLLTPLTQEQLIDGLIDTLIDLRDGLH